MNRRDLVGGLIFLALGAAGLYWAVDLPFGNARLPGPAMLPSTLSALIMVFAAVHLVRAWRQGRQRDEAGSGADRGDAAAGSGAQAGHALPGASLAPPLRAAHVAFVGRITQSSHLLRVGNAALLIALFVALVRPLGFIPTTFLAMSALYAIADERGLGRRPLISGAILTATTYVLFAVLLEVPLPEGTLWN